MVGYIHIAKCARRLQHIMELEEMFKNIVRTLTHFEPSEFQPESLAGALAETSGGPTKAGRKPKSNDATQKNDGNDIDMEMGPIDVIMNDGSVVSKDESGVSLDKAIKTSLSVMDYREIQVSSPSFGISYDFPRDNLMNSFILDFPHHSSPRLRCSHSMFATE